MTTTYDWDFPLSQPHSGVLLGNGVMGAMVWGRDNRLRLTIGRADFWDHRGGSEWTADMSYANVRKCLADGDEDALNALFKTPKTTGQPQVPTVLPIGRVDLEFAAGTVLDRGHLDIADGRLTIDVQSQDKSHSIVLFIDMAAPTLWVLLPDGLPAPEIVPVTSWEFVGEALAEVGFAPPTQYDGGWTQTCPVDPAMAVGWSSKDGVLAITTQRGDDAEAAKDAASEALAQAQGAGHQHSQDRNQVWWDDYWSRVPVVQVPNDRLSFLYWYGMYKFASFTHPDGVAATLQGSWIEEFQLPPWSSDYHFNINVQLCYQPAYHGNLPEHMQPLWDLLAGWTEQLRHNAKMFLGIDDGLLLPHAVSDRCTFICGYWGHSVDHGCTAWVAQMMFRHYRFTGDKTFLEEQAFPFMKGTMRVYEEMIERDGNGNLQLPVGISPEYFTSDGQGWGPNASFQLASIHRLCEDLVEAAQVLGEAPKAIWHTILGDLPKAALVEADDGARIGLWDGLGLPESHRHHSHLAGITPFDVIDPDDDEWREIVWRSLDEWILRGPALWSGWCLTWASMLSSHVGHATAAELWLDVFDRFFCNEGGGTLHDVSQLGVSTMGAWTIRSDHNEGREVMQMDGGMGSAAAVQEMLLHSRRGVIHLFAGAPRRWRDVAFQGMRAEGAFLVSAERSRSNVTFVEVKSLNGGQLKLANPWNGDVQLEQNGQQTRIAGQVLTVELNADETVRLTAVG